MATTRSAAFSPPPSTVEPLTADLIRVHLTADKRFAEKLERAKDALSHSLPAAGFAEVLEAGLDLLIERQAKRRGLVEKPRATPPPSSDPEYVPAQVRREVWKRDGGKCQWPLASSGVCGSTRRVELDHRIVRARGGPPTVENLRCLCDVHNDVAAREVFGDAWMDRFTTNPRGRPPMVEAAPVPRSINGVLSRPRGDPCI